MNYLSLCGKKRVGEVAREPDSGSSKRVNYTVQELFVALKRNSLHDISSFETQLLFLHLTWHLAMTKKQLKSIQQYL